MLAAFVHCIYSIDTITKVIMKSSPEKKLIEVNQN